jgi:hypothetical protein
MKKNIQDSLNHIHKVAGFLRINDLESNGQLFDLIIRWRNLEAKWRKT